jgi:cytochrome c-type biogenesis protein CcmH/NrfG
LVIIGFFYTLSGVLIFPAILLAVLAIAILFSESETRMRSITFSLRAAPQYALASTLLLLMACIGALSLFATLGKMYVADMYARQAFEIQAEQRKLAIGYIEKAIQLNPQEGQYFVFRGRMYLALANEALGKLDTKDNEKAVQEIQLFVRESVRSLVRGRNLLPGDIFSQEGLAQQLESLGNKDEAFVAYQDAEKIEPKNPMYPTRMAKIRIIQAQTEEQQDRKNQYFIEADRLLEKSLAIKGNYGEAWYQKALLAEGQKNMDKAIEFAQKALDTDNDIRSGLLVARLYQARGGEKDTKAAEELLNKILGVNDNEINAQLSLALLYEKTGRTQEAIDRYEKARDLLPQGAKKARDQIDEIVQGLKDGTRQQQIQSQDQGYGVDVAAPESNQ